MSVRKALPVALSLVLTAGALAPAVAAPKPKSKPKPKPITETYTVQGLPVPLPLIGSDSCTDPRLERISITTKTIKTEGPGTLEVTLTKFSGDWDITVMDDKRNVLGTGAGTSTPTALAASGVTEKAVIKTKKGMTLNIAVCNFFGGPSAEAKYTFTYK